MFDPILSLKEGLYPAAKSSLTVLKSATLATPLPYFHAAVQGACMLMEIMEQVKANKEQRNELDDRLQTLMLSIATSLEGRTQVDVPQTLKSDIERLASDIRAITIDLRKIASQPWLKRVLYKDVNADTIQTCLNRLRQAIDSFEVSRHIHGAITQQKQSSVLENVEHMVEDIRGFVSNNPSGHVASALPSFMLPPTPHIFHGRDKAIHSITHLMCNLDDVGHHIAIIGPGGMGKTTLAVVVMEHPNVVDKFGANRFWVPCIEATSVSHLLDLLVASLRITETTNDRLRDIVSELMSSLEPKVVLLDNFETPWDFPKSQSKVRDILCTLAKVGHLTILITMRCYCPPGGIEWAHLDWSSLPALDESAARQVYTDIHADAASDPSLGPLLTASGCMPLAVTLLARLGKNSGDLPGELLQGWNKGMDLLNDGMDSGTNINLSIGLSTNSNQMNANPDAITLLAILSIFPGGVGRNLLPQLVPNDWNISGALATLTQLALAERRPNPDSLHVQPVIRSYMRRRHPLNTTLLQKVQTAYYRFVLERKSDPGHHDFKKHVQDIANEEANIQAILIEFAPKTYTEDALDAMASFGWYQFWTRPRAELIDHTVNVARDAKNVRVLAESLRCQGLMYHQLDRYDEACRALAEARQGFQTRQDPVVAALCLLELSRVYRCCKRREDARQASEQALVEFLGLRHPRGVAESMMQLGELYRVTGDLGKAHETLWKARQELTSLDQQLSAAHCLSFFSEVCLDQKCFDAAERGLETARLEYLHCAYSVGAAKCLTLLGIVRLADTRYPDALATFQLALCEHEQIGIPSNIAECLQGLGLVYRRQGQYNEAIAKYQEARRLYERTHSFHSTHYAAQCLEGLGTTYFLMAHYDEARAALEQAIQEYEQSKWFEDRDRCKQRLAEIGVNSTLAQMSGRGEPIDLKTLFLKRLL